MSVRDDEISEEFFRQGEGWRGEAVLFTQLEGEGQCGNEKERSDCEMEERAVPEIGRGGTEEKIEDEAAHDDGEDESQGLHEEGSAAHEPGEREKDGGHGCPDGRDPGAAVEDGNPIRWEAIGEPEGDGERAECVGDEANDVFAAGAAVSICGAMKKRVTGTCEDRDFKQQRVGEAETGRAGSGA